MRAFAGAPRAALRGEPLLPAAAAAPFDSGLFRAREANDERRGLPVFINLNQYSNLGEGSGCVRAGAPWCVRVCACAPERVCVGVPQSLLR